MKKFLILVSILILVFAGCDSPDKSGKSEDSNAAVQPDDSVSEASFGLSNSDYNLVITKDLLSQEFVMMPTLVEITSPYTTTDVFATKLVYFDKVGDSLYLMEAMDGKTVTDPYDPVNIIAQFPIVEEQENKIVFDFKKGFDSLIIAEGDYSSADSPSVALPTLASYIENFISDKNSLSFDHIAQVNLSGGSATVHFNYTFMLSNRDNVAPLVVEDEVRFGYFLTKPIYERSTGNPQQVINRWNISQPITFYVSSNTPEDYFESVKQGILAWNDAFESDLIKVKKASDKIMLGTPGYNVVQWVGFDKATGAYTIWHAHPITGEILKAGVVLPSVFAVTNKDKAKRLLATLDTNLLTGDANKKEDNKAHIGLAGFESIKLCENDFSKPYREFLNLAASGSISDNTILDLSKLFVKYVVMHEIGHSLGLRHNFYGNLGSKAPLNIDDNFINNLLTEDGYNGSLPSASIMDYLDFKDAVRMHRLGEYDIMAIRWGYGIDNSNNQARPLYCTDEDIAMNADCEPFDGGNEPILWRDLRLKEWLAYMSSWVEDVYFNSMQLEDEDAPEMNLYLWQLARLADYIDVTKNVLEINGSTVVERRAKAADVLAEYLKASDQSYDAVLNLATDKLLTRLLSQNEDQGKVIAAFGYIQSIRDMGVAYIFDLLSRMLNPSVSPIIPVNELSTDFIYVLPEMTKAREVVRPIALALSTIAANHISTTEPSEPMDFRLLAARIIRMFEEETVKDIRNSAAAKIRANIAALEKERQGLINNNDQVRYNQLIADEQTVLIALGGGSSIPPLVNELETEPLGVD